MLTKRAILPLTCILLIGGFLHTQHYYKYTCSSDICINMTSWLVLFLKVLSIVQHIWLHVMMNIDYFLVSYFATLGIQLVQPFLLLVYSFLMRIIIWHWMFSFNIVSKCNFLLPTRGPTTEGQRHINVLSINFLCSLVPSPDVNSTRWYLVTCYFD